MPTHEQLHLDPTNPDLPPEGGWTPETPPRELRVGDFDSVSGRPITSDREMQYINDRNRRDWEAGPFKPLSPEEQARADVQRDITRAALEAQGIIEPKE